MKLTNKVGNGIIDYTCLNQYSKKIKNKLLELIESGDIDSVIEKLSKKQKKLSEIYEKEGGSDNFLKKTKKWIEKVNLYLDHGGKVYLLETAGGDFHYLCITDITIKDNDSVVLRSVAPFQYQNKGFKNHELYHRKHKKDLDSFLDLEIGKVDHAISH